MSSKTTILESEIRFNQIESNSNLHILIIKNNKKSQTISLKEEIYSIGRSSKNSIIINSQQVSRIHGTLFKKIYPDTGQISYCLIDGEMNGKTSSNGIFVNSKQNYYYELKHGDVIEFSTAVRAIYQIIPLPLFLKQRKRILAGKSNSLFIKKLNFHTLDLAKVS